MPFSKLIVVVIALFLPHAFAQPSITDIITVPVEYSPTSGVSLVEKSADTISMFYRGPAYQLIQADVFTNSTIGNFQDLGGQLQTPPHAETPDRVVYARADMRVVMRVRSSSGVWGSEIPTGLKTQYQPRFFYEYEYPEYQVNLKPGNFCVSVTALNSRIQSQCWTNYKRGSVRKTSTYSSGVFDEYFTRNKWNTFTEFLGKATTPYSRITSGSCFTQYSEGIQVSYARGSTGQLVQFEIYTYDENEWYEAGVFPGMMTGDPDCIDQNSCIHVIYPVGQKFGWFYQCT